MTGDKENVSKIILGVSLRTLVNVMLLFLLVEGFVNAYHFSYKLFSDIPYMPASSETKSITIEAGSSAVSIAELLEENGVVEGKYLFLARLYLGKYQERIIAGSYTLGPGMSPEQICKNICGIQSEGQS